MNFPKVKIKCPYCAETGSLDLDYVEEVDDDGGMKLIFNCDVCERAFRVSAVAYECEEF